MIEFKNVSIHFAEKQLINDLSFFLKKGEHLCLSGGSGAGKSTLLKLLQGYVLPSKGEVFVDNLLITPENIQKIRSAMVYIPQNVNLPVRDGRELADLLYASEKLPQTQSYMEKLGLSAGQISQSFDLISGGEKQRLVVSICLALNKNIILLDEPTSSLDQDSIKKLMGILEEKKETTIVSSSHNQNWIASADKRINL